MSDYSSNTILVQHKVPLRLQRLHWMRLKLWLSDYLRNGQATNSLEKLVKCALIQIFIKVSKQVQKLGLHAKEMKSYSIVSFTPLEKYCLEYLFSIEYEAIGNYDQETFYTAYLQPILDQLHAFEINQNNSTDLVLD
jgi:hypothetical protein